MNDIEIREAASSDFSYIYKISREVHNAETYINLIPIDQRDRYYAAYTDNDSNERKFIYKLRLNLSSGASKILIACHVHNIVGYIMYTNGHIGTIDGLFVRPKHQGMGIGSKLLKKALEEVTDNSICLKVLAENKDAIKLYERVGFTYAHDAPRSFYGAKLHVMQRSLT